MSSSQFTDIPTTMQSWQQTVSGGGISTLTLDESPVPEPAGNQMLLRVLGAALNWSDLLMLQGTYQDQPEVPFVPGRECVAEVVLTGPQADREIGTRVLYFGPTGAFSTYLLAEPNQLYYCPPELNIEQAAGFFVTSQSAWFALHRRGSIKKGETVLIQAGAGGFGSACIRLANAAGATIIATAGDEKKCGLCLEAGADYALNYRTEHLRKKVMSLTAGQGVDLVIESVGGNTLDESIRCLCWEGRLVIAGFSGGTIPAIKANRIMLRNITLSGLNWPDYLQHAREIVDEAQRDLAGLVAKRMYQPDSGTAHPFSTLPIALQSLADRKSKGKLILVPGDTA